MEQIAGIQREENIQSYPEFSFPGVFGQSLHGPPPWSDLQPPTATGPRTSPLQQRVPKSNGNRKHDVRSITPLSQNLSQPSNILPLPLSEERGYHQGNTPSLIPASYSESVTGETDDELHDELRRCKESFQAQQQKVGQLQAVVQAQRKDLKVCRDKVSICDSEFMKLAANSTIAGSTLDRGESFQLLKACQDARNKLGPLEDDCERLELKLGQAELDLIAQSDHLWYLMRQFEPGKKRWHLALLESESEDVSSHYSFMTNPPNPVPQNIPLYTRSMLDIAESLDEDWNNKKQPEHDDTRESVRHIHTRTTAERKRTLGDNSGDSATHIHPPSPEFIWMSGTPEIPSLIEKASAQSDRNVILLFIQPQLSLPLTPYPEVVAADNVDEGKSDSKTSSGSPETIEASQLWLSDKSDEKDMAGVGDPQSTSSPTSPLVQTLSPVRFEQEYRDLQEADRILITFDDPVYSRVNRWLLHRLLVSKIERLFYGCWVDTRMNFPRVWSQKFIDTWDTDSAAASYSIAIADMISTVQRSSCSESCRKAQIKAWDLS